MCLHMGRVPAGASEWTDIGRKRGLGFPVWKPRVARHHSACVVTCAYRCVSVWKRERERERVRERQREKERESSREREEEIEKEREREKRREGETFLELIFADAFPISQRVDLPSRCSAPNLRMTTRWPTWAAM